MGKKNGYDYSRFLKRLGNMQKSGVLYEFLASGGDTPMFSYAIRKPDGWRENWETLSGWISFWENAPKGKDGHLLYTLNYENKNCGSFGRQRVPRHALVKNARDGLALLGMEDAADTYLRQRKEVEAACPLLLSWHTRQFDRIQKENLYPEFLSIARAFLEGRGENKYKREIQAHGVDTKFIERHSYLLRTLWNALHPESQVENMDELARKLAWKEETAPGLYIRFLDDTLSFYGASQCFMDKDSFAHFHPPVSRVFITENKVNGYTFPAVPESLVLAGTGYGILDFADGADWLKQCPVYYWGDLDTDGFYILSKLREKLPEIRSFLMTGETAERVMDEAVADTGAQTAIPQRLTVSEKMAWDRMRTKGLRIEQERIPAEMVRQAVEKIMDEEREMPVFHDDGKKVDISRGWYHER